MFERAALDSALAIVARSASRRRPQQRWPLLDAQLGAKVWVQA